MESEVMVIETIGTKIRITRGRPLWSVESKDQDYNSMCVEVTEVIEYDDCH